MWSYQQTGMKPQQQPVPPGWEAKYDPANRRWFYVNHVTKTTQWEDPRLAYSMRQQQSSTSATRQQPHTQTTSFIEADPDKANMLISDYSIDIQLAQEVLRTHSNNLNAAEVALRIMGYEKSVAPNETMVNRLQLEYTDVSRDLIKNALRMTKNNLPGSRLYLEALGYKKTTAKNRPAATKTARTGAPAKAVTSQPPKAAANKKPKISAAEKNKRSTMLKKKFPDVSQSTIGMCLETSHYSISMAEKVLTELMDKEKTPKSEQTEAAKKTKTTAASTPRSFAPAVFGQDEQSSSGAATSYSSAGASTASGLESSKTLDSSSSKSATIAGEEAERTPAPKQRQKKIQTIKTRAVRSKYVYITNHRLGVWVPSGNRIRPNGPNPVLRKGPDPSLLINEYMTPKGPNQANYTGPQASNRCGPLPSHRMGPAGHALGPVVAQV